MTPALSAVYEELRCRACETPWRATADAGRRDFAERTGIFPLEHPQADARIAAAWEDTLVTCGLATALAATLEDPAERALALVIARAQRGIFRLMLEGDHVYVEDLWGGGAFVLLPRDELARGAADLHASHAPFVGRVVAAADGCALLPGLLWLPEPAVPHLDALFAEARVLDLTLDAFADALLRMDHALHTLARVQVRQTFRPEALRTAAPRTKA